MKSALVIFLCTIIVLSSCNTLKDTIENFAAGTSCNLKPGENNNVICISKTQFVLGYQDPNYDTPLKCPSGTVCADVQEICSITESPTCINDVPGVKGVCNICDQDGNNPVCINKTQYSFCANGKIISTMTYSCAAPTPNCKATIDSSKALVSICTAQTTGLDCPT